MANFKIGLEYYSADTDRFQDIRIKRLKKDFGCDGFAVYEYILNEIYRVKGCFLAWDESTAFDVAEYWGLKETKVNEIVRYCCAVGLFDKALLSNGSVLSSPSIQSRYVDMCIRAKRKSIIIPEEYDILPEKSRKILEEYLKPHEGCRKVKKSKGNIPPIIPPLGIDPDYGDEILPMEKLKSEIPVSQSIWLEQIAMLRHLTPNALNAKLDEFFDYLTVRGKTELSVKNFKNYFGNWLDKGLKNKKEEDNGTITW